MLAVCTGVYFVALDAALDELEQQHHRPAQVVMQRHLTGLEIAQIAKLLDVSKRTVDREWASACAWLQREIDAGAEAGGRYPP